MKQLLTILLIISNLSIFSQTDLGIKMATLSEKYPDVTFYRVYDWEDPTEPNIRYFNADFGFQEYYYLTDSLETITTCMFKYHKFRLPSLILTYNEQYKVTRKDELWEYSLDKDTYVIVKLERNTKGSINDYFITFETYLEDQRKYKEHFIYLPQN
jgi:hypothetical protein